VLRVVPEGKVRLEAVVCRHLDLDCGLESASWPDAYVGRPRGGAATSLVIPVSRLRARRQGH
jgi:hypothetical protein